MSVTYSLVCPATKQKLWIGQANMEKFHIYDGDLETMTKLKDFLWATKGKALILLTDEQAPDDYEEFGGEVDDT